MAACDMGKWDGMVTRRDTGMGTCFMLRCLFFSLLRSWARGSSSVRAVPMIQYAGVSLEGMPWLGKTLIFKRLRFQTYNLNLKPAASAVPRSRSTRPPRRFVRDMVRDRSRPHTRAHAVNTEPTYVISLHPPGRRITANPPGARRRGPHRARHMCAHHAGRGIEIPYRRGISTD